MSRKTVLLNQFMTIKLYRLKLNHLKKHSVIIVQVMKTFDLQFQARIYLLSAGFSLTFGSMFAKSYRVHRLFTYTTTTILKDKLLKDQQLIGLILIPLLVDVITISLWMVTDPLKRHLRDLAMQISDEDPRILYQLQVSGNDWIFFKFRELISFVLQL